MNEYLSFIGTLIGSLGGILVANNLTNYRIKQLEDKLKDTINEFKKMTDKFAEHEKEISLLQQAFEKLKEDMNKYHS